MTIRTSAFLKRKKKESMNPFTGAVDQGALPHYPILAETKM
jgi:hypothetical protein